MPEIVEEIVKVTTTGSAGSASGNADSPVMMGFLLDWFVDFHASAPATTDVTLAYVAPSRGTIAVIANSATDTALPIAPRMKPVDNANAAITNAHDKFPLNGKVNVALAQCDALTDAVVVYIRYLRI